MTITALKATIPKQNKLMATNKMEFRFDHPFLFLKHNCDDSMNQIHIVYWIAHKADNRRKKYYPKSNMQVPWLCYPFSSKDSSF